jgi:putative SOS response-associated peptidase YedK
MPAWGRGRLKQPLVNIRSETLRDKRTFDKFLSEGRCLIPADGFYEWKTEGKRKRPVFVRLPGGALFYMAGLRENESEKRGCAIITAPSGEKLASLHHRMPLILDREESLLWLEGDTDRLLAQVREPAELQMWPVSSFVNDPGHDSPLCAVPLRPVT